MSVCSCFEAMYQGIATARGVCLWCAYGSMSLQPAVRPFGDNGVEAEHWSENALHPYPGNVRSLGDSIKLIESGFPERKAIVIFGYEHSPPLIDITIAIDSFEAIAKQVVGVELGARQSAQFGPLIHPVHQQGKVFGWQVLGLTASPVRDLGE